MCFVFIWEQTATCTTYIINWLGFITEIKSVSCAVRTGSLNKAICASSLNGLGDSINDTVFTTVLVLFHSIFQCNTLFPLYDHRQAVQCKSSIEYINAKYHASLTKYKPCWPGYFHKKISFISVKKKVYFQT